MSGLGKRSSSSSNSSNGSSRAAHDRSLGQRREALEAFHNVCGTVREKGYARAQPPERDIRLWVKY